MDIYTTAIAVSILVYINSGSRGVILTDTLMFLLFTVASAAAVVFLVCDLGCVPSIIEDLVVIRQKKDLML